ncbi:beta-ketoacyl synthase N-terminal-like domain-containing protein [Kribbella sp. NPDC050820]|uniref:beta-ketoacyl synthase N-terminal-like domain-containing protein n=1 Tax=Kribbella sp. NPDC050820 TaxID=3155408 RepID=UPI0033E3C2AB
MALLAGIEVRTCLGDGEATFARMMTGASGARPLLDVDPALVNVSHGYQSDVALPRSATQPLLECLAAVAGHCAGPVPVVVGTGLREIRPLERWALEAGEMNTECLDFGRAVSAQLPGLWPVTTISNACSASGHALAIAQDMVDSGEAEAVAAAGTDVVAASMLAMIGRVSSDRTTRIRPFDIDRTGVLLGEGAAAALVVADGWTGPVAGRILATGLSCDAFHETAPSRDGIVRAIRDAHRRAGCRPADIDLVVAHGTGTALNDPTELAAIREVFGSTLGPLVTAGKGAIGHTSGAAALVNLDLAVRAFAGEVPPITGLDRPVLEAAGVRLVVGSPVRGTAVDVVQVNAFGFGGVNAVTLLARPGR